MTVIVGLAFVWALVLVPPAVRRRKIRPGSSVSTFRRSLDVLGRAAPSRFPATAARPARSAPRGGPQPPVRSAVRKRRRDVLLTLTGTAAFTLLLAVAFGGVAIALHLVADVALGAYVYLLVRMRKQAAEQAVKVRYLDAAPLASQPRLVSVRRSG